MAYITPRLDLYVQHFVHRKYFCYSLKQKTVSLIQCQNVYKNCVHVKILVQKRHGFWSLSFPSFSLITDLAKVYVLSKASL